MLTVKTLGRVFKRNKQDNPGLARVNGRWTGSQKMSPELLNQIELKINRESQNEAQWDCRCVRVRGRWWLGRAEVVKGAKAVIVQVQLWLLNKRFGLGVPPVAEKG